MFNMSQVDHRPPLTFYGEEQVIEDNNVQMQEEEADIQQAFSNAIKEETQIQTVNRFKE